MITKMTKQVEDIFDALEDAAKSHTVDVFVIGKTEQDLTDASLYFLACSFITQHKQLGSNAEDVKVAAQLMMVDLFLLIQRLLPINEDTETTNE